MRILEYLDHQRQLEAADADRLQNAKLAMLSGGYLTPADAFPDLFGAGAQTGTAGAASIFADPETPLDYSGVQWESPGEEGYDRLMAMMNVNETITTRDASGTTEGVKAEAFPLGPDDPEWT